MKFRASRAVIISIIIAVHIAALRLLPEMRGVSRVEQPTKTSLVFITLPAVATSDVASTTTAEGRGARPPLGSDRVPPRTDEGTPARRHVITPAPIDWASQAQAAATRHLERDAEAKRQASALSQWRENAISAPTRAEPSNFGWDSSRINRVQSTAEGLVVQLNDRCSIVINVLLVAGGCNLSKSKVRADLFEYMSSSLDLNE